MLTASPRAPGRTNASPSPTLPASLTLRSGPGRPPRVGTLPETSAPSTSTCSAGAPRGSTPAPGCWAGGGGRGPRGTGICSSGASAARTRRGEPGAAGILPEPLVVKAVWTCRSQKGKQRPSEGNQPAEDHVVAFRGATSVGHALFFFKFLVYQSSREKSA